MQLFHKNQFSYSEEEKHLAKTMHYTSLSLYKKMREESLVLYYLPKVQLKHGLI